MVLTETQKNCPYCHEPYKELTSLDGYKTRIALWTRFDGQKFYCLETLLSTIETDDQPINVCPMCGRDLGGE